MSVLIKWTQTSCVHFFAASEVGAVRRTASIYPRPESYAVRSDQSKTEGDARGKETTAEFWTRLR